MLKIPQGTAGKNQAQYTGFFLFFYTEILQPYEIQCIKNLCKAHDLIDAAT
tara:strand:- start:3353 stop:3505 length:153 start_codon:yes stop_codon:yes gene_type:complete